MFLPLLEVHELTDYSAWIALESMGTICIFLTAVEIVLFIQHQLQPLIYLISQSIKTALWIIVVLISISTMHRILLRWREEPTVEYLVVGLGVELYTSPCFHDDRDYKINK